MDKLINDFRFIYFAIVIFVGLILLKKKLLETNLMPLMIEKKELKRITFC
jgi:hypothetical protein